MAKFVPDIKTQRWVIISPARINRPEESNLEKPAPCAFCAGNESLTPSEITRMGQGEKDKPGWTIRVVPNKFPITDTHEVIIHSPDHTKDIEDFELSHVVSLVQIYRERYLYHQANGQVMIFSNHGEFAGASLSHPHSQLVVLPKQINLDTLVREPVMNVVDDNNFYITYCPDFSQWPYEIWIAPKRGTTTFAATTDEEIKDLANILQRSIRRLKIKYSEPKIRKLQHSVMPFSYNFYIHHAKDWFIRIIPRWVQRAGFELGTGLSVNEIDPTEAAEELKSIKV